MGRSKGRKGAETRRRGKIGMMRRICEVIFSCEGVEEEEVKEEIEEEKEEKKEEEEERLEKRGEEEEEKEKGSGD